MAQPAILAFKDYKGREIISGISTGQNEATHRLLNGANDWMGEGPEPERCDLLAPFDCCVMAIAAGDNAVFFQSTGPVMTPVGTFNSVWFMCVHGLDADIKQLGIKVGKTFKQGAVCYTEGNKGLGSGPHIHMEQGFGRFGGGSMPYYRSNDTYTYKGRRYYQYYPNVANGGAECPAYDIFFLKAGIPKYLSEHEKKDIGAPMYAGKWKTYEVPSADPGQSDESIKDDALIVELQMALSEAKNALKQKDEEIAMLQQTVGECAARIQKAREALEE